MENVRGYIDHIVYQNAENGYAVLHFITGDGELTLVGTFRDAGIGDILEVEGEFVEHAVYGRQFKAARYTFCAPEDAVSIQRYLSSGAVKGIGASLAARIVKAFEEDAFRIMEEEPERLAEIKGISLNKARDIGAQMREKREMREVLMFLQRYAITGALAVRIYNHYKSGVYAVLRENPYRLASDISGVGFKTADEIASRVGIATDSAYRIKSGLLYTLQAAAQNGDCYLPKQVLTQRTAELLSLHEEDELLMEEQMDALMIAHEIVRKDEDAVYSAAYYRAEGACASMLYDLAAAFVETGMDEADERLEKEILTLEAIMGITLDDLQREAVKAAVTGGVFLLSGGPGTGKTTTINTIIRYYVRKGMEIALAAPTGRAAKRMTEATGFEAKTIHRLLEVSGGRGEGTPAEESAQSFIYEKNADNPLEADVVIIDEASMVDLHLFNALLKALLPGTHLILVGDAAQLPSVGPGQILKDLIESGKFRTVILKKIFRQAEESDIVLNAHRIHRGEMIHLDNDSKDFFFLPRNDIQAIYKHTVQLIRDKLPGYVEATSSEIQVLTPMRKGPLGVETLNRVLQEQLNPPGNGKTEYAAGEERLFRTGDKVMQVKNNYQAEWEIIGSFNIPVDRGTGVFNGDLGTILEIDLFNSEITVEFDEGRRIRYPFASLDEIELAYAVTIHKSQGSEYPAVVMPLLGGPKMLLNRNLLYTGVTRAKRCVVILGSRETVQTMIENETQLLRYTGLKRRIGEVFSVMNHSL